MEKEKRKPEVGFWTDEELGIPAPKCFQCIHSGICKFRGDLRRAVLPILYGGNYGKAVNTPLDRFEELIFEICAFSKG